MNVQQLQNLKRVIESKKQEMSRLQGAKESAEDALKDLGFDTVEDAEDYLDELNEDILKTEKQLKADYESILKEFPDLA